MCIYAHVDAAFNGYVLKEVIQMSSEIVYSPLYHLLSIYRPILIIELLVSVYLAIVLPMYGNVHVQNSFLLEEMLKSMQ